MEASDISDEVTLESNMDSFYCSLDMLCDIASRLCSPGEEHLADCHVLETPPVDSGLLHSTTITPETHFFSDPFFRPEDAARHKQPTEGTIKICRNETIPFQNKSCPNYESGVDTNDGHDKNNYQLLPKHSTSQATKYASAFKNNSEPYYSTQCNSDVMDMFESNSNYTSGIVTTTGTTVAECFYPASLLSKHSESTKSASAIQNDLGPYCLRTHESDAMNTFESNSNYTSKNMTSAGGTVSECLYAALSAAYDVHSPVATPIAVVRLDHAGCACSVPGSHAGVTYSDHNPVKEGGNSENRDEEMEAHNISDENTLESNSDATSKVSDINNKTEIDGPVKVDEIPDILGSNIMPNGDSKLCKEMDCYQKSANKERPECARYCSICIGYHDPKSTGCLLVKSTTFVSDSEMIGMGQMRGLPPGYFISHSLCAQGFGVFTMKHVPCYTRFGPLQGEIVTGSELLIKEFDLHHLWPLYGKQRKPICQKMFLSTKHTGNWMCWIQFALDGNSYNMQEVFTKGSLYFVTTKSIKSCEELVLRYLEHPYQFYMSEWKGTHNSNQGAPFQCKSCKKTFESLIAFSRHMLYFEHKSFGSVRSHKKCKCQCAHLTSNTENWRRMSVKTRERSLNNFDRLNRYSPDETIDDGSTKKPNIDARPYETLTLEIVNMFDIGKDHKL